MWLIVAAMDYGMLAAVHRLQAELRPRWDSYRQATGEPRFDCARRSANRSCPFRTVVGAIQVVVVVRDKRGKLGTVGKLVDYRADYDREPLFVYL